MKTQISVWRDVAVAIIACGVGVHIGHNLLPPEGTNRVVHTSSPVEYVQYKGPLPTLETVKLRTQWNEALRHIYWCEENGLTELACNISYTNEVNATVAHCGAMLVLVDDKGQLGSPLMRIPENDADGDGLSDAQEKGMEYNPCSRYSFIGQQVDDGHLDYDGDGAPNVSDIAPKLDIPGSDHLQDHILRK
ncbi:hypothetical protein JKY72_02585 [Candidatus Gracilibacteria bacterium]|nr:hypothetical protein [Candidatus Gracilibacteria bacterium]